MNTTAYSSVITAQSAQTTSPYFRKTALIAGVIYLLTFVSIPTLSLYAPIHMSNYVISDGPDTKAIIGAILELIVGLAGIATAVVLYPVLKKQNESGALGLVASRVLEAAMIFGGVAFLLTIVSLRQGGVGNEAVITGQALVTMYDRIFLIGQSLMPAVNDLLLGFLFYHSRLIPRALALIGIIGSFLLVSGDVAIMFGVLEQRAPSTALAAVPVAIFEFALGIWLVVKGFRNPNKTSSASQVLF
jgi:hypothetical protein